MLQIFRKKKELQCEFIAPEECKEKIEKKCREQKLLNGCTQKECCIVSTIGKEGKALSCKKYKPTKCPTTNYEKCQEMKTKPNCSRRICFKYSQTGDKITSNGCYMSSKVENCVPTEKIECNDLPVGKECFRQWCCKVQIIGGIKKTKSCTWNGEKKCKKIKTTECKLVSTTKHCKRTKCCKKIINGKEEKIEKCSFKGKEICSDEPPVRKCSFIESGNLCKRKQCCLFRYTRDDKLIKIENSCIWDGAEICSPIIIDKCFKVVTKVGCEKMKCCSYQKIGKTIKLLKCLDGKETCKLVPCSCPQKKCDCSTEVKIVCGDGKNYQNECVAKCSGAIFINNGKCPITEPPTQNQPICSDQSYTIENGKCSKCSPK